MLSKSNIVQNASRFPARCNRGVTDSDVHSQRTHKGGQLAGRTRQMFVCFFTGGAQQTWFRKKFTQKLTACWLQTCVPEVPIHLTHVRLLVVLFTHFYRMSTRLSSTGSQHMFSQHKSKQRIRSTRAMETVPKYSLGLYECKQVRQ